MEVLGLLIDTGLDPSLGRMLPDELPVCFDLGSSTGLFCDPGHCTVLGHTPLSFMVCLWWTVSSSRQRPSFVRRLYQGKDSGWLSPMVSLLVIVPSSTFLAATVSVPWEK